MVYPNPNPTWLSGRGVWATYLLLIATIRVFLGFVPSMSDEASWAVTSILHNTITWIIFHLTLGVPFETEDQGKYDTWTHWEQIDGGQQFTSTKKFLTSIPIVLFLISTHYSTCDNLLFAVNFLSVAIVLISKLPQLHKVRLFWNNNLIYRER
eukprot:Opistho-2@24455